MSAIYDIYGSSRDYIERVWGHTETLAKYIPLHLFVAADDVERALLLPNIIVHVREFRDLETYNVLNGTTRVPDIRNNIKDTKEFMILMNAKTEFLERVMQTTAASHYIWIDSGITKILPSPGPILETLLTNVRNLRQDKIFIPGCSDEMHATEHGLYLRTILWRFCGGFFVVPKGLVRTFYETALDGCITLCKGTGVATWEVNVWAYIESRLPIQWEKADHNRSMLEAIVKFRVVPDDPIITAFVIAQ